MTHVMQGLLRQLGVGSPQDAAVQVEPLAAASLSRLRLAWDSRLTSSALAAHVAANPQFAWRVAGTDDYAIGDAWQGRADIGAIVEVAGGRHQVALLEALLASMRQAGALLAVLSQGEEGRALDFYRQLGWTGLQEVLVYRRPAGPPRLFQQRLTLSPLTAEALPALLAVENAAFPWLWRFGPPLFEQSAQAPVRRLLLGSLGAELVGYVMFSLHRDLGHLDRLAVHPRRQGQGFGSELLARALSEMASQGAATIGLSTQSDNLRSQRLYQDYGFRRNGDKYDIYGKWLTDDLPGATPGMA